MPDYLPKPEHKFTFGLWTASTRFASADTPAIDAGNDALTCELAVTHRPAGQEAICRNKRVGGECLRLEFRHFCVARKPSGRAAARKALFFAEPYWW